MSPCLSFLRSNDLPVFSSYTLCSKIPILPSCFNASTICPRALRRRGLCACHTCRLPSRSDVAERLINARCGTRAPPQKTRHKRALRRVHKGIRQSAASRHVHASDSTISLESGCVPGRSPPALTLPGLGARVIQSEGLTRPAQGAKTQGTTGFHRRRRRKEKKKRKEEKEKEKEKKSVKKKTQTRPTCQASRTVSDLVSCTSSCATDDTRYARHAGCRGRKKKGQEVERGPYIFLMYTLFRGM
jgi:hypothetical protein